MTEVVTAAAPPRAIDAITRPIPGQLLRLALPVFASQLLRLGYQWVDAMWVQGLGVSAQRKLGVKVLLCKGSAQLGQAHPAGGRARCRHAVERLTAPELAGITQ